MPTKKWRCDTRSPPPFETPPPIAREEHEQNWHTCCTFDLDTLECNICMDYLVAPICQVKHAVKTVEVPSNEWVETLLELTVDSADHLLKTKDMLFLFHHEEQLYGRVIYILSFAEASQENAYRYHVEVHLDETVFSMTTIAKSVRQPGKDQVASSLIISDDFWLGR
jgi:hypothetical protein